jgi:hypothetical protein
LRFGKQDDAGEPSGLEPLTCSPRRRFRARSQSQPRAIERFDGLPDGATT